MKRVNWLVWVVNLIALLMLTVVAVHTLVYLNRVVPRVWVGGVELTGLTESDSIGLLRDKYKEELGIVRFYKNGEEIDFKLETEAKYDYSWGAKLAMLAGRNGNLLTRLRERIEYLYRGINLEMPVSFEENSLDSDLAKLGEIVGKEVKETVITIEDGKVVVNEGWNGERLDEQTIKQEIVSAWRKVGETKIEVPMIRVNMQINEEQKQKVINTANLWLGKSLLLKYGDWERKLADNEVVELLGVGNEEIKPEVFEKLVEEISIKIGRDPENAVFRFEDGKVVEFKGDRDGVRVDEDKLRNELIKIIYEKQPNELTIPVILTPAKVKAAAVNNLGLKEIIGIGKSKFAHSIPGRVFNVNLAASRINSTLIAPGEEFSFNKAVGEISRETGYQAAYIIQEGKTVLGDGGGVCQVSTTVFRAALNAGLPITERKAHAYRVGYYEQDSKPGVDATVFNPSADLKFKNDTSAHILIQTFVDTKNLNMRVEIYGTKDGRKATITEPKIYSQTPAPADLYTDDPTLPKGQIKQIDWAAAGAKVSFDYKVEKDGQTIFSKTFFSNYQPWQAVYLRGTKE